MLHIPADLPLTPPLVTIDHGPLIAWEGGPTSMIALLGCSASCWIPMKITLINPPHTQSAVVFRMSIFRPLGLLAEDREVLQFDLRRWDYKHQVLNALGVPPWRMFLWFKMIEVLMQARPRVLGRMLWQARLAPRGIRVSL